MPGMPGMPSGMQPPVSGASIPPARPLFPSAAATTVSTATVASTASSVTGSAPLGTDFKPITSVAGGGSIGPVKPTFPAYSSAGEITGVAAAGNSLAGDQKVNLIATTGAASKIIHPPEDLSLVSHHF